MWFVSKVDFRGRQDKLQSLEYFDLSKICPTINEIQKTEKAFIDRKNDLAKLNKKEIEAFIDFYNNIRKTIYDKKLRENIKKNLSELIPYLENIPKEGLIIKEKILSFLEKFDRVFECLSIFTILHITAIFTYPHATLSRYPNKMLSFSEYTENLGIIGSFREILLLLNESIECLEYFNK